MHRRRLLVLHKSRSSDASFVRLFLFPSSFFLSFVLSEPSISTRSTNNRATVSGGQLTYFPAVSLRRIGNLATFPNHGWKIRTTSFSRICGDNMRHEFPALRSSPPVPLQLSRIESPLSRGGIAKISPSAVGTTGAPNYRSLARTKSIALHTNTLEIVRGQMAMGKGDSQAGRRERDLGSLL